MKQSAVVAMPEDSDEALMLRIGQGEAQAFSVLVARHISRVIAMAWRVTGSKADGEDVAQDAFARVWINAPKWRPSSEGGAIFSTWLYRVVMNLCIDRKRRMRSEPLESVAEPVDLRENAFERVADSELSVSVARAVAQLPERQRIALVLCFYEGMTNFEVAEIMSLTVGAVESLLVRARRTLKTNLAVLYAGLVET